MNNSNIQYQKEVICKEITDRGIIEISHSGITSIELKYLVHLYLFLLTKPDFMERLFNYLYHIIKYKVTKSGKNKYNVRIADNQAIQFLPNNYNKSKFLERFI